MEYIEILNILSSNLRISDKVNSYDKGHEKESDTIAFSLLDICESLKKIDSEYIPKLLNEGLTKNDVDEVLLDIGEELRHILYHIRDNHYYNYLK